MSTSNKDELISLDKAVRHLRTVNDVAEFCEVPYQTVRSNLHRLPIISVGGEITGKPVVFIHADSSKMNEIKYLLTKMKGKQWQM